MDYANKQRGEGSAFQAVLAAGVRAGSAVLSLVGNPALTRVDCPRVRVASVHAGENAALTELSLPALESGEAVELGHRTGANPRLTTLRLPALESLSYRFIAWETWHSAVDVMG